MPGDTSKIISTFVDAEDKETGEKLTKDDIFAEAHLMLFGGTETTSSVLTFLIYQLTNNPKCYKKVQSELYGLSSITAGTKIPYLEAAIKETLRQYPPVINVLFRDVPESGLELLGYHLPSGTQVSVNLYSMHHSSTYWIRPKEFLPEIWLGHSYKSDKHYDYVEQGPQMAPSSCYIPFSLEPRGCIGKQ